MRAATLPTNADLGRRTTFSWSRTGVITQAMAATVLTGSLTLAALPPSSLTVPTPAQVLAVPAAAAPLRIEVNTVGLIDLLPDALLVAELSSANPDKLARVLA